MRRRLLFSLPLMSLAPAARGQGMALEWVAGDLPPFAWRAPDGTVQGYAHDLALAMARRLGRPAAVRYYPWARAVRLAETSEQVGVFPLARTPAREPHFRWLIPLLTVRYAFVTLVTDTLLNLADLRELKVGVLRGSPIIKNLRAERFTQIVEAKDYRDLLRMLLNQTLGAVYAGAPMLDAAIDEYGHPRQQFTTHTTLGEATLYMATSPRLPAEEAERWLKAYQQLEDDGSVARLKKRYFR
jgi:polar amino acid transport system substrate-binding protein